MDEDRLIELEIRYTIQQDLLQQLSDVLARHDKEIERLKKEVEFLRKRLPDEHQPPFDPDEKPPHY